jgi:HlyD family secretion protein
MTSSLRLMSTVVAVLLAACGGEKPTAYQGYVEGEYVYVASSQAGTLVELAVDRGSRVERNARLFVLEQDAEQAARREAAERLKQARARLANLTKGLRPEELAVIEAQYQQALAALAFSEANFRRQEKLIRDGFVSPNTLDAARSQYERDRARAAELEAQRRIGRLPARPDEIRAAEAEVKAAEAALAQVEWRLTEKAVVAPVGGYVEDRVFLPGEWVPAGSPVISILPPENLKLRFFVPEPDLPRIRIGQQVSARCDGCSVEIPATVAFVSSQPEFTPPVIFSRERREKLVFRVEAKVAPEHAQGLHPGQPVDVELR